MSVLQYFPSRTIPNRSETPAAMIIIKQKKLQAIHLVLLALVHHLCTPFFHSLGPVVHPRSHSRLMNCRSAKHIPMVVWSGVLKKESTASPRVTIVGSRKLTTVITMQQALTQLQQMTMTMTYTRKITLQFSAIFSLLHPLITTSSPVVSLIPHGSPFVTFDVSSLGLHVNESIA